ncbi:hypothetical protein PUN28_018353 [Cardiocondyla obscurior]|uniref:Secreted protein n=1 Tax=Cardiocondyla obscurior TaxID=286306 RepID=A0AAW2EGZ7_9HYME
MHFICDLLRDIFLLSYTFFFFTRGAAGFHFARSPALPLFHAPREKYSYFQAKSYIYIISTDNYTLLSVCVRFYQETDNGEIIKRQRKVTRRRTET